MWSSYFLVACGVLLEVANILWNRAGHSMVLIVAPLLTSIGIWQFGFTWQVKVLLTILAVGVHVAVFVWGMGQIRRVRDRLAGEVGDQTDR